MHGTQIGKGLGNSNDAIYIGMIGDVVHINNLEMYMVRVSERTRTFEGDGPTKYRNSLRSYIPEA